MAHWKTLPADVHSLRMKTAAYLVAALASLAALFTAAFLTMFAGAYYGSAFYMSVWPIAAGIGMLLLLASLAASGIALARLAPSQPDLPVHRRICGTCGLLLALVAVPVIIVDRDWAFASSIAIAGVLVAAPWLIGRVTA